jgi:hypothetical protein
MTPPSEDFSDSKISEEWFSSEGKESPPSVPLSSSPEGSDDSMGLSATKRAYAWSIEMAGLKGSGDSKEEDSSEDFEVEGGGGNDGSGYDGDNDGNAVVGAVATQAVVVTMAMTTSMRVATTRAEVAAVARVAAGTSVAGHHRRMY